MPNRDFSLVIVDSRLWRSTADRRLWMKEGWGADQDVFVRRSPHRTILGEEQAAWLHETIRTDSSGIICVSGVNVLNTIYNQLLGGPVSRERDFALFETNCFDFAGWQAVPAKRLLELFGSREGIVTLYGDLHHAGICRNTDNGVIEAHFGVTGIAGYLRSMKHDFASEMKGYNGERVEVIALYHQLFETVHLTPRPQRADRRLDAQNFMEMEFDTRQQGPTISMRIRHLLDRPQDRVRGGAYLREPVSRTGRGPTSRLPSLRLLPMADVLVHAEGRPVRGLRSLEDGSLPEVGLADVLPGTTLLVTAQSEKKVISQLVKALPLYRPGTQPQRFDS